jgi:hypothetical protein
LEFSSPYRWLGEPAADAIRLPSRAEFDRFEVRTQRTVYEMVVLNGSTGEVLVRGGDYFREFKRARVTGSTRGGSAVRLRTIEVGARLELHVDGHRVITSTIQSLSPVRTGHDRAVA